MRLFTVLIMATVYLFSYGYQDSSYYQEQEKEYSDEEIIEEEVKYITADDNYSDDQTEFVEYQPETPQIEYINLKEAKKEAIEENKFIFIKIESTNCPYCERLNSILDTNLNIKDMIIQNTKAVRFNREYDTNIPVRLNFIGTPTLFLFDQTGRHMLMKLEGRETIDDLEDSLQTIINEIDYSSYIEP